MSFSNTAAHSIVLVVSCCDAWFCLYFGLIWFNVLLCLQMFMLIINLSEYLYRELLLLIQKTQGTCGGNPVLFHEYHSNVPFLSLS